MVERERRGERDQNEQRGGCLREKNKKEEREQKRRRARWMERAVREGKEKEREKKIEG